MGSPTSPCSVYAGLPRNEFTKRKLGELPDKLCIYFQKRGVSQGCDVDSVSRIDSGTSDKLWMEIIFSEPSGVQHVLSKSEHDLKVDGWDVIPLEVRKSFPSDESSQSDDNESSDFVDAVDTNDINKGAWASDRHRKAGSAAHEHNQSASQKGFPPSQQSGSSRNAATLNLTALAASLKDEKTPSGPVSTQRASNSGGVSSTQSLKDNTAGGEGSYQDTTDDADLYGPDPKEPCIENEAPTMRTSSSEEAVSNYTRGKGSETQEQGSFQAETELSAGTSRNHQPVDGKQCQFTDSGKKQNGSSKRSEPKIATRQNDAGKQERDGHVPQEMAKSSDGPAVPSGHTGKRKRNRGKVKRQSPKESPEEKRTAPERQENNEVGSHRDDQVQEGDSPDGQQVEEEQEEKFVEVTGFSPSSEEMLKMHFENPRRSGGGEIETWEHDVKTGAIRLTYQDPSLVSKVIAKQHKVGGATLSVRLVVKKKPRPRPVNKRCLLLRGISDGCSSELVTVFVENRCGTDDFKIQYGEMPGTALCTFNEDIPDLENVIKKISLKKLKGVHVTAEKVHESDCILVQGVSSRESLEMIELYFDNKKKSGGEGVRDVQQGPDETQAIIFFDDWKVVRDVLSKKGPHKVGGTELSIEEYHECFGRISPLDVPTPHIPKPVSVQVSQPVMEFIFGQKGQHTKNILAQKLSDVKAILKWPNGDDKTAARLDPLEEDGQRQSSWLKWPEVAPEALKDFLNRFKSSKIAIPAPLWKDTVARIDQLDTKGFSIELDVTQHIVNLVGMKQVVETGTNDINKIIKELKEKAEYEAQQTKQDVLITAEKFQPFIICGIKDKIENAFPDLKITVTASQGKVNLIFEGTRKTVQEAELSMRRQTDNLEKLEFKAGKNKVQFVCSLTDKIHEILGSQSIRAACKGSEDGKIIISGATKKDTMQAKAYIDQEIIEDIIPISGRAALVVLRNPSGRKLLDGINRQKFAMAALSDAGNSVELAGFKTNIDETKQKIITFLKNNVIVMRTVQANKIKIRLISTFHGADLVNIETQNARNHVKIQQHTSGRNKGFVIQGNEDGLEASSQFLTSLVAKIKIQPYPISKTGMAQLFRETKARNFLESLEKELQCVISENVEEESDDEEEAGAGGVARPLTTTEVLRKIVLSDGFTLKVCRGDLTRQKVDCIVNAANVELKHMGGLAAAIVKAGGRVIQTECEQILKTRHRKLFVGEPVDTSSGSLPCKRVIHVAGPRWPASKPATAKLDDEPTHEEKLLYDGVKASLKLANKLKMQSIAIPAISTGVYGFPVELAAQQILNAVDDFCQSMRSPTLKEIHLTNHDLLACNTFKQAVDERFKQFQEEEEIDTTVDVGPTGPSWGPPVADDTPPPAPKFTSSGQYTLTTNEGINITLKKGSITKETVDVLVNTVGSDMNLSSGRVSQALLQAAGSVIQHECNAVTANRGNIPPGDFIETGPGVLACKKIYHCVCAGYQPGGSETALKKLILKLMEQAEQNEMLSIAIPALGTGNLNYPAGVTAQVMYESILEFSSLHPNGVLKDVRFVVYDKDVKTIQGFEGEIQRLLSPARSGGATGYAPTGRSRKLKKSGSAPTPFDPQSYSAIQHDQTGMLQTKIGSVCLQVGQGDLVKEPTDAIVNSVGPGLDLQGPVSQAIIAKGGKNIAKECDYFRNKDSKKLIYTTSAGLLQCSAILHVVTPTTPEEIKVIVFKTLKQAEEIKLKSVSFPALGTGQAGKQSVANSASAMLKAVGEFAVHRKPHHLRLIRLVIFQPNMVSGFQDALKKEVGTSYKPLRHSIARGIADFAKSAWSAVSGGPAPTDDSTEESFSETMILNICAMDMSSIKKATDKLDQFQNEEYTCEDKIDELGMMDKMTDEHRAELKVIERKNNVKIVCLNKGRSKIVQVKGRVINVKDAHIQIQEMFTKMQKEELKAQKIELLSKEIQWRYSTQDGVEAYEPEVNALIEEAYKTNRPSVTLDLEDGKVTIHFQNMQEVSRAGPLNIHRIDLTKGSFEMPSNWIPMDKREHYKTVQLTAGTPDYTMVESQFQASVGGGRQIQEIHRIQNRDLMMQYQARKAALEVRLGRTNKVEETLYHGTDEQTCDKINKQGFNRSFCGKNATMYGNGTYFAVSANYSARDQYSRPDGNGVKRMYLAKVLVGDYIRGNQGMITPPNKPSHPDQQYDSVVDNINQPSIFVIFHDAQAYPEFLIKFT